MVINENTHFSAYALKFTPFVPKHWADIELPVIHLPVANVESKEERSIEFMIEILSSPESSLPSIFYVKGIDMKGTITMKNPPGTYVESQIFRDLIGSKEINRLHARVQPLDSWMIHHVLISQVTRNMVYSKTKSPFIHSI